MIGKPPCSMTCHIAQPFVQHFSVNHVQLSKGVMITTAVMKSASYSVILTKYNKKQLGAGPGALAAGRP